MIEGGHVPALGHSHGRVSKGEEEENGGLHSRLS